MRISERLGKLEMAVSSAMVRSNVVKSDAAFVLAKVEGTAIGFGEEAEALTIRQRLATLSPAQHCAWEMRFADDQTPVFELMAMHEAHRTSTVISNEVHS